MAKTRIRDLVVFLPGITGSVLARDGKDVWGLSVRAIWSALSTGGRSVKDLTLVDDDPTQPVAPDGVTAPRLVKGPHLVPGLSKIDGYAPVVDAILKNFDVVPGDLRSDRPANFFEFPYDWRRDVRAPALLLQRLVDERLPRWREASGAKDARVILVAHSMGGLVARHYLEVLGGWESSRALVTYGTPYRGSLNALGFLANGFRKLHLDLTEVLRSCPSVYQLLPIYPCVADGSSWRRVGDVGIDGLDARRAADALAFHRAIEAAVAEREGDGRSALTVPVVGTRQPTTQYARLNGRSVTMHRDRPAWLDENLDGGDGTVPRVSAVPIELSDAGGHVYVSEQHGTLHANPASLNDLLGRLQAMQAKNWRAIRGPDVRPAAERASLSVDLDDAVPVGTPVEVEAWLSDGAEDALSCRFTAAEGGAPVVVAMERQGDGRHRAAVPLAPGIHRAEVRPATAGPSSAPPVHDLVAVLD